MKRTKTDLHPAAIAAANWWAEQIGAPTFNAVGPNDSPEDHGRMGFASMMQTLIAAKDPVSGEQGAKFAAALAETLTKWIESGRSWMTLGVDYGPDRDLADAAEKAGVALSRFPWKTVMWVKPDHVVTSLGYQGQARLVWSADGWDRPACGSLGYDVESRRFEERRCGLPRYHDGGHGDWKPLTVLCGGCGLTEAGHNNRDVADGDWHAFKVAEVEA